MRLAKPLTTNYEPRPSGSGEEKRSLTVAARTRRAFTLIEMLVVIAIILILAGMIVAVAPGVSTRQQSARGATQLQGALLYAKNRAKLNMLPTGITLSQDASGNLSIIQFVQGGGDFAQGLATSQGNQVQLLMSPPPPNGTINSGDYLEMAGSGLPHLIVGGGPNGSGYFLGLAAALPTNFTNPVSYRVMRSPRQLFGEDPVQLPQDVAVDLTMSRAFPNPSNSPNCPNTILFSPSGALTGPSAGYDIVCFIVRDTTLNFPQGFPTIIAVYGKTGFITAHPVSQNGNPFYFAQNARSSGM